MKANRNGGPCPEWCTEDHHGAGLPDLHAGETARTPVSGSPDQRAARRLFGTDPLGDRWAASGLVLVDVDGASPQVSVAAGNRSRYAQLWLDPEEAGKVADLLDLLTYATPTQMQRLARGIREAIETRAATTEV